MPRRLCAAVFAVGAFVACSHLLSAAPDRASEILARARQAIGGEARLKAVTSLSLKARSRSEVAGSSRAFTNLEMHFLLPDKFLVTRDWPLSFLRRIGGFNGNQLIEQRLSWGLWADIGFGDGSKEALARQMASRQRDCVRYLVAWLLTVPEQYDVRFTDAGEAQIADGRADVVDAKGANDFAARLFFDKQTHHLLMLTYQEPPQTAPALTASPQDAKPPEKGEPLFKSIEAPASKAFETQMHLNKYRADDGIVFPHRVRIESEGVLDEWQISRFKVNPPLGLKQFERKRLPNGPAAWLR
jgi:hypothetical protein